MYNKIQDALLKLNKTNFTEQKDLQLALRLITKLAVDTLNVSRCSIWFYNKNQSCIKCIDLYDQSQKEHSSGAILEEINYPIYFEYIKESRTLMADDARLHPTTSQFTETYLKPLNIYSMLDAPIRTVGKVLGVICLEQTNEKRLWLNEEALFAGALADYAGRAFELFEHIETLKKIEMQNLQISEQAGLVAIGELAAGISHEINNPLQILIGLSYQLERLASAPELDRNKLVNCCKSLTSTVDRTAKIVSALKGLVRMELVSGYSEINVPQIIKEAISYATTRSNQQKELIRYNNKSMETPVFSNPVALSQAIVNLLNNSIEAIEKLEDPWIEITSEFTTGKVIEKCLKLSVTDSGDGIPKEIADKIMKPLFTQKATSGGTGIGLTISKRLIQQIGGDLYIDVDRKNTTFVIEIPI